MILLDVSESYKMLKSDTDLWINDFVYLWENLDRVG